MDELVERVDDQDRVLGVVVSEVAWHGWLAEPKLRSALLERA
ncbi:hypothetical protein ACFVYV_43010 [Streptomyces mirabilis]